MKISKVLLIAPPVYTTKTYFDISPSPPIGLGYLASMLEKMGLEVRIVDCLIRGWNHSEDIDDMFARVGLSDAEIKDIIADFEPDLIGMNCQFTKQHKVYHHMFKLFKEAKRACVTAAGGAHPTVLPEEVLGDPNCDFVLMGEGEESFGELIASITGDSPVDKIDGLGWKRDGKLHINPKEKWIEDLDSIPFPAYHLMELERYFGLEFSHGERHRARFSPIVTSRGCPAKCTFCSAYKVWGRQYRFRSVDNVLAEMRLLKEKHGIEELAFEDDNVTANPKRAKELFSRMTQEGLGFVWDTPNGVGVWSVDEEMIDLMKKSGCIKLNFPAESGSQDVVDRIINKPIKLKRIKELIKHCHKIGLDCGMFLVMGMPGEKLGDIWKSFTFAAESGCYEPVISVATPYPGTKLFEECAKKGLFAKEFELDDLSTRGFMIRTADWDEKDLKRIFVKGDLYLKFRNFVAHPGRSIKNTVRKFGDPASAFSYFKRTIGYFLK